MLVPPIISSDFAVTIQSLSNSWNDTCYFSHVKNSDLIWLTIDAMVKRRSTSWLFLHCKSSEIFSSLITQTTHCDLWLSIHICYVYCTRTVYRPDNFVIGLTSDDPRIRRPTLRNYTVCGQYHGGVASRTTVSLYCQSNLPAFRYLILQIPRTASSRLYFRELRVLVLGKRN